MNIRDELRRAIKYGIYLGPLTESEERKFIKELFTALIAKKNFCTLRDNDKTIVVSTTEEDLAEAFIHEGTLKVVPMSAEGYFQIFMDVLEFLAEKHKRDMQDSSEDSSDDNFLDDESTEEEDWWL